MVDKNQCAHDIAISLLSKSLNETNSEIFTYDDKDNGNVNALEIVDSYLELFNDILDELNSR